MKITGWMVNRQFEMDAPLIVYVNSTPSNWQGDGQERFEDGVLALDRPNITSLCLVGGRDGFKYINAIPAANTLELHAVEGIKDGKFISFAAANQEYANLANKNAGNVTPNGPGSGINNPNGSG